MIKSLFIPTNDIESYSNYYLVQLLAKERVKSIMEKSEFKDVSKELVKHYLTVPPKLVQEKEINDYIESESKDVLAGFKRFEENKAYRASLELLKDYTGYFYDVTSVTLQGIMVLVEIPDSE